MPPRNVLIFHLGALGDFLLTCPLTLALARLHPQSRIICIAHAQKGALAERLLRVEWRDIESGWHALFAEDAGASLPAEPARLLAGAHSIYSFIAREGDRWTANARGLAPRAEVCCLDPRPPEGAGVHAVDHQLAQLAGRPALAGALRQIRQLIGGQGLSGIRPGEAVAIHPGSGSPAKCWPAERYLELAQRLRDAGRRVRVIVGEVELECWPTALIDRFAEVAEVCRPETCVKLLDCLDGAAAYVGNDSGPTHLAAMVGLPTIALFGVTDPAAWRPLGPRVTVIERMHSVTADAVLALLHAGLST